MLLVSDQKYTWWTTSFLFFFTWTKINVDKGHIVPSYDINWRHFEHSPIARFK